MEETAEGKGFDEGCAPACCKAAEFSPVVAKQLLERGERKRGKLEPLRWRTAAR